MHPAWTVRYKKYSKTFNKYLQLDKKEEEALTSRLTERKIKRKQYILHVGDVVSGNRARVKVIKNKVAPPFRMAELAVIFGRPANLKLTARN